jgi:phosphatidylglycerophosphate synthase
VNLRLLCPSIVTAAGLACGVVGLMLYPSPAAVLLMVVSLALDVFDGWVARDIDAVTPLGGELDWHVDVALAHVAAWSLLGPWAMFALVALQTVGRGLRQRVSGRAVVFGAAIVAAVVSW